MTPLSPIVSRTRPGGRRSPPLAPRRNHPGDRCEPCYHVSSRTVAPPEFRRCRELRNQFDAGSHFMETRYSPNHVGYQELGTKELRTTFLVESLFAPEKLELIYSDADRAIIGSAVPLASPIKLTADADL